MSTKNCYKKVQICVFCNDEILLLKVSQDRGGFWQNVTGSVEEGEDFEEAAGRELEEETGILTKVFESGYEFNFFSQYQNQVIEKTYYCFLKEKPVIKLSEEHDELKWVKIDSIQANDYKFPSNFEAFKYALRKLSK